MSEKFCEFIGYLFDEFVAPRSFREIKEWFTD